MRILVITQQNSGVGYHRLMLPVHFLPKAYALITDTLSEETLKEGWDIVYINRFIPAIHISVLEDFKERYGFKLVIDIDDYWHLDQWHILKDVYPTQAVRNLKSMLTAPVPIKVNSWYLQNFDIYDLVVREFDIPQVAGGISQQPVTITFSSSNSAILVIQ